MILFVFFACTSSKDSLPLTDSGLNLDSTDSGDSTTKIPDGGLLILRSNFEGMALAANLYGSVSGTLPEIPDGEADCRVTPHSTAATVALTVSDLDLGTGLFAEHGSDHLAISLDSGSIDYVYEGYHILPAAETLSITHTGPSFAYTGSAANIFPAGQQWTVTSTPDGAFTATVDVPGAIQTDLTTFIAGQPLTVQWTGGAGAQHFHVFLNGDQASADCYAASNTTSLEISADVTTATGNGSAVVSAERVQSLVVEGHQVRLIGVVDILD